MSINRRRKILADGSRARHKPLDILPLASSQSSKLDHIGNGVPISIARRPQILRKPALLPNRHLVVVALILSGLPQDLQVQDHPAPNWKGESRSH